MGCNTNVIIYWSSHCSRWVKVVAHAISVDTYFLVVVFVLPLHTFSTGSQSSFLATLQGCITSSQASPTSLAQTKQQGQSLLATRVHEAARAAGYIWHKGSHTQVGSGLKLVPGLVLVWAVVLTGNCPRENSNNISSIRLVLCNERLLRPKRDACKIGSCIVNLILYEKEYECDSIDHPQMTGALRLGDTLCDVIFFLLPPFFPTVPVPLNSMTSHF